MQKIFQVSGVKHEELKELIKQCYHRRRPLFIWGAPGIGKSLKKGTPVVVVRENKMLVLPIEKVKVGDYVIAITEDLECRLSEVKGVLELPHKGTLLRVYTKTGRVVEATPDHSFVVLTNGKLEPKRGSDLIAGKDLIPTFRGKLPVLIRRVILDDVNKYPRLKYTRNELELNYELGFIVGAYLAEGCSGKTELCIANLSEEFKKEVARCVKAIGFGYGVSRKNVFIYGVLLTRWIVENFGKGARNKRVPAWCLFAPEEFKIGLLAGYFSGDGDLYIQKREVHIEFSSASKELRDGIALLLSSIGIGVSLGTKEIKSGKYSGRVYYRGYIFDKKEFLEKIPIIRRNFDVKRAKEHLQEQSNFERIVVPREILREFYTALKLYSRKKPSIRRHTKRIIRYMYSDNPEKRLTRVGLKNYIEKAIAQNGGERNIPGLEELIKYIESKVIFDEIVKIERMPYSGYVYDIETEEGNFMLANGVFVHNSYMVRDAAKEIAKELNLQYSEDPRDYKGHPDKFVLIDIRASQLDPVDWRGIPIVILRTNGTEKIIVNPHNLEINNHVFARTSWAPPAFLPDEGQGIIFLDELNLAVLSSQHASYQLILDRRLGEYILPDGWVIIAAGNRVEDVPTVVEMSKALENRFLHVELEPPSVEDWTKWAANNKIDPRIIGFVNYRKELLFKFDPRGKEKAFPTPRSWEFASDMIKKVPTTDYKRIYLYVRSAVGEGAAREFVAFLKLREKLPNLNEIIRHPERAKDITDLSLLHALVTNLAEYYSAKKSKERLRDVVKVASYIPPEFAYLVFFLTKSVDPLFWTDAMMEIKEFDPIAKKWIEKGYLLD